MSFHLLRGLPLLLVPSMVAIAISFRILSFCILSIWPYHPKVFNKFYNICPCNMSLATCFSYSPAFFFRGSMHFLYTLSTDSKRVPYFPGHCPSIGSTGQCAWRIRISYSCCFVYSQTGGVYTAAATVPVRQSYILSDQPAHSHKERRHVLVTRSIFVYETRKRTRPVYPQQS